MRVVLKQARSVRLGQPPAQSCRDSPAGSYQVGLQARAWFISHGCYLAPYDDRSRSDRVGGRGGQHNHDCPPTLRVPREDADPQAGRYPSGYPLWSAGSRRRAVVGVTQHGFTRAQTAPSADQPGYGDQAPPDQENLKDQTSASGRKRWTLSRVQCPIGSFSFRRPWRSFQGAKPFLECGRSSRYGGSCSDVCYGERSGLCRSTA